jgi:hypothetical protein
LGSINGRAHQFPPTAFTAVPMSADKTRDVNYPVINWRHNHRAAKIHG